MDNSEKLKERRIVIEKDEDDSSTKFKNLVTFYATQYRKYLLDNGYMTIEQLMAFDAEVAVKFEKEVNKEFDSQDMDWEKIKNEVYYSLMKYKKHYVKGTIFVDLYNLKKDKEKGKKLN